MKGNMNLSYYENAKMKYDDGSHGHMREEDKKREVVMSKIKCSSSPPKFLSKPIA